MKVSVYSLIFREYGLEEFAAAASSIGYAAIELRVHEDGVHLIPSLEPSRVREVKRIVEEYGLEVCCLSSYAKLGYPGERGSVEVRRAVEVAHLADVLEVPLFRVKVAGYDPGLGYEGVRSLFRRQLSQILSTLKREGVESVPVVEQHGGGDMAHSTCMLKDLLRGFDPEIVGVIFDPGNSVREGWLPLPLQLDVIKEYVKHVHVKNYDWDPAEPGAVRPSPLDRGIVDWGRVVESLKSWGFKGCLSLEDFRPIPPVDRAREALVFFKKHGVL
ncbi:MAG: hypothetical protein DRJ43_05270 [Thermoprotei archaeon]|nr:MAG: hypothetical protein DRJ43_05270 [Thermoprotei archaeon]